MGLGPRSPARLDGLLFVGLGIVGNGRLFPGKGAAFGAPVAGVVTSAAVAADDAGTAAIVRVLWSSAAADLRTADGVDLVTVGSLD